MKRLIIFLSSLVMILLTACQNTDDSNVLDSQINKNSVTTSSSLDTPDNSTTTNIEEFEVGIPPYYWVCNEIIHYVSGQTEHTKNTILYSGPLDDFNDDAIFDGYELKGELYSSEKINGFDKNELEAFGFKDGMEVYYNSEKDSYILSDKMDVDGFKVVEHKCNSNCVKVKN